MATTRERMSELVDRLNGDSEFATALELDSVEALRREGFDDLASTAQEERARIGELVDRIYSDEAFRQRIEDDPVRELSDWGFPEIAMEPLLRLVGAPEEVLERATADVEAHLSGKPATVAALAAVLGALAFAQQASAGAKPAGASAQFSQPAAYVQVSQPAARAEISQPARAKVEINKPARAKAEINRPARATWHGVQAQQARAQGSILSVLGIRGR
jgi:hypothetical protein